MKLSEISSFKSKTARKIRDGYLHEALADMRSVSEQEMNWETTTRIDAVAENYSHMLRYLASGASDPERRAIYDDICADALMIVDLLVRSAFMRENPSLYYSTARTRSVRPSATISRLISDFREEMNRLDGDFATIADAGRTRTLEGIQRDLFNAVWTTHPLSTADFEALGTVFDPNSAQAFPEQLRSHLVSAITLGLLEFYDSRRLIFLLRTYLAPFSDATVLRALTGALSAFYRYRFRPVPKDVDAALAAAADSKWWNSDVASVAIEMARATSTDKISDKLNKEIIPQLMKIDPDIQQKLRSGDFDPENLGEGLNPEWEEKLRDSGVAHGLQEIQEIQADGGDVFMGSFSHMKHFGFFNEISNWFLPFYDTHSTVADKETADGSIGTILQKMPILCDSDKYSMILAFDTVPENQRAAMLGAVGSQAEQMREALSQVEQASELQKRRNIINKYVQNIYRFYMLFRRKNEFFPLFSQVPNILEVKAIGEKYTDETQLGIVGEFLFRHSFWPQAVYVLDRLDHLASPLAQRSQQIGYALEKMGLTDKAVSRYEEAELLDGNSVWTLRHLASALRHTGQPHRAVDYYLRLSEMLPDDPGIALSTGYALSEAGNPAKAETYLHKAAYLMPDSEKPLRALAWTQFLNRRFESADATYARLIAAGNDADDLLNAGHVKLAMNRISDAISLYRLYGASEGNPDIEHALNKDSRYLARVGADLSDLKLLIEAIKYA